MSAGTWPAEAILTPDIVWSHRSPIALGPGWNATGHASAAYPSANLAIFVPLYIAIPCTVTRMYIYNGATVAGNADIGIYDRDGNKIVSKGATALSGTSRLQFFDITDTQLTRGIYYYAMAHDSTSTFRRFALTIAGAALAFGVKQMASAYPLPSTATFADFSQTALPLFGGAFAPRTTF